MTNSIKRFIDFIEDFIRKVLEDKNRKGGDDNFFSPNFHSRTFA